MRLLSDLKVGSEGRIVAIRGEGALVERIRELGFVEGEQIFLAHKLWGNGSQIVYVQNASVALRKDEADCIALDEDSLKVRSS